MLTTYYFYIMCYPKVCKQSVGNAKKKKPT